MLVSEMGKFGLDKEALGGLLLIGDEKLNIVSNRMILAPTVSSMAKSTWLYQYAPNANIHPV